MKETFASEVVHETKLMTLSKVIWLKLGNFPSYDVQYFEEEEEEEEEEEDEDE
jgi:hypothetical protein